MNPMLEVFLSEARELLQDVGEKLMQMEVELHKRIVGQDVHMQADGALGHDRADIAAAAG